MNQRHPNDHWINPLLTKFDLIQPREVNRDPAHYWKKIEECHLIERVSGVVAEVNGAAGYHVLEMQEYLPPQKNVFHVNFDRNRTRHKMELILQDEGILLVFSSTKQNSARWDRYFPGSTLKDSSTVTWEQIIRPEEVLQQNIQAWLSYLLSGLSKEFRLDQILHAPDTTESVLSAALRKLSA